MTSGSALKGCPLMTGECAEGSVVVRKCWPTDFSRIIPLLEQLWPTATFDTSALHRTLTDAMVSPRQLYLCAAVGERLVGFGSLSFKYNLWVGGVQASIDELVVDVMYRRQGVGRLLLEALESAARKEGANRIVLVSGLQREESHAWYRRRGYADYGLAFCKSSVERDQ